MLPGDRRKDVNNAGPSFRVRGSLPAACADVDLD